MVSRKKEALVRELNQKLQDINNEFVNLNTPSLVRDRTHYSISGLQQYVAPVTDLFARVVLNNDGLDEEALDYLLSFDDRYYLHSDLNRFTKVDNQIVARVMLEHGMYTYNFKIDKHGQSLIVSW